MTSLMHSFTSHVSHHVSSPCGAGKLSMPPMIPPGRRIRNACSLRLGVPRAFLPFADFAFEPFIVNLSETQLHDRHISSTVPTVCFVFSNWEVLLYHHSVLFLFPIFHHVYVWNACMCVCILHVCGGVYVEHMCTCTHGSPKLVSGIILSVSSILLNEAGSPHQTQSSLVHLALLIRLLLESPVSPF